MKAFAIIAKVLTALVAIAGVVYIIATYGDKIVAWAKNLLNRDACAGCECNENGECTCEYDCDDCDCCDCECDNEECECDGECCCEEGECCCGECEEPAEEVVEAAEKDFEA